MIRPFFSRIEHPEDEIVIHTALRGAAALGVVLYHASLAFPEVSDPLHDGLAAHGYLFVDLFFVLSGYIICLKYLGWFRDALSLSRIRTFMALRIARLYPNYLFWFFAAVLMAGLLDFRESGTIVFGAAEFRSFLMHLVGVQGVLSAPVRWNIPLWSISVEIVSYALFPALAFILSRGGQVSALLLAGLAAVALGWILARLGTVDVISGGLSVLRGVAGFTLGMVLAGWVPGPGRLAIAWLSLAQVAVLVLAIAAVSMGYEGLAIACFVALVYLTQENRGILYGLARFRPLHVAGTLSFSVYLSHTVLLAFPLLVWWKFRGAAGVDPQEGFYLVALTLVVLSLVVSAFAYRLIEVPGQRWMRARFVPSSR